MPELLSQVRQAWAKAETGGSPSSEAALDEEDPARRLQPLRLTAEDSVAADLIVRYASALGVSRDPSAARADLEKTLVHVRGLLGRDSSRDFDGFDWFAAVAFVMTSCSQERTREGVRGSEN